MAETRAVLRGVRLSVDKGRLVADLIRGKKVDQALNILTFTQKKAAGIVKQGAWSPPSPTPSTTTVPTSTN
jgi:large subunit ribosomal protein L22